GDESAKAAWHLSYYSFWRIGRFRRSQAGLRRWTVPSNAVKGPLPGYAVRSDLRGDYRDQLSCGSSHCTRMCPPPGRFVDRLHGQQRDGRPIWRQHSIWRTKPSLELGPVEPRNPKDSGGPVTNGAWTQDCRSLQDRSSLGWDEDV